MKCFYLSIIKFYFNSKNFLVAPNAEAGAVGGDGAHENDAGMLQALQESIRDFIRDIGLTNIGEAQQQPPADDDNDENNPEFD